MANTKDFERAMLKALIKITSPQNMRKYGESAAQLIKTRTRLGSGVASSGGDKQKLKALSSSYKEQRKKFKQLSSQTSPGKSNLTRTGQMLDSMGVKSVKQDEVKVGPMGSRTEGNLTNEKLSQYVTEAGRPFNNLSKIETKRIATLISDDLEEEIKNIK